jgi:hypothetical protein
MTLPAEVEGLLSDSSPEVRAVAIRAREVILDVLPGTIEQVDPGDRLVAYGRDRTLRGLICAVALHRNWANLMFSRGTELTDPDGLLEGTGKRARHVRLRVVEDVERSAVRALIEEAGRLTPA